MRRLQLALSLATLCASNAVAQAAAADPEIYLMPLSVAGGKISVGKPVNITNRPGYDNQPAFSADGREIYYTSTREDAQADIYKYHIASKKTERVTKTAPESEYSATVMPSHERISVIRVEKDSAQRLWSFTLNGSDDRLVLPDIKPVGYHAWIDPFHLALFVLGTPNSLVLVDTRTGKDQVLAHDIGRSLLPFPVGHGFTFLSHHDQEWVLTEVRLDRSSDTVRLIRPIVTLPAGMDFVAWIGTSLIGGTGSKLYTWKPGGQWTEIADLAADGLTRITRIAVSPDHQTLAVVAEPAPPANP
jgi:dipeptidyl aminopeptidase/acylaminoacyl peptidase